MTRGSAKIASPKPDKSSHIHSSILNKSCRLVALLLLFPPAANAECPPIYKSSGPIQITRNNQIIRGLIITSNKSSAVVINGFSGTELLDVVIHHRGGHGIDISNAPNTRIASADIVDDGAPPAGPDQTITENSINCYHSPGLTVSNVRLTRGSSGIYLDRCFDNKLSGIEGIDIRGNFPRGQLVQWNNSSRGLLDNFSAETYLATSFTEDILNVYRSYGISISHGLVDGNTSPSGDGVIIDQGSFNVHVSDVDALHQSNGCFAAYGGGEHDVSFTRTRCADTLCVLPNGAPLSGSLAWAIDPQSSGNITVIASTYSRLCNAKNLVFDRKKAMAFEVTEAEFNARSPLRVVLCRYAY